MNKAILNQLEEERGNGVKAYDDRRFLRDQRISEFEDRLEGVKANALWNTSPHHKSST